MFLKLNMKKINIKLKKKNLRPLNQNNNMIVMIFLMKMMKL